MTSPKEDQQPMTTREELVGHTPGPWCVPAGDGNVQQQNRAALATLQPSGERREAIARALAEKWPGDYMQGDDECEREPNALAYETADLILAVQDEAGWRDINTAPKDKIDGIIARRVLLANTHGSMFIGYWSADYECWQDTSTHARIFSAATHWKPLPAPPIRSARDGGAS